MRGALHSRSVLGPRQCLFAAAVFVITNTLTNGLVPEAKALPSFARQTGQPCGTCHTDFPFLTPYGRRFKLLGYTVGGGMFRTTPFPTFPSANDTRAQADKMRTYAKAIGSGTGGSARVGSGTMGGATEPVTGAPYAAGASTDGP